MRRLRLLGPVTVDEIPESQHKTAGRSGIEATRGVVPRFRSRRTIALLGYLAAEHRAVGRDQLAFLFWPDEESSKGRGNLRRELHNLTQILPGCWLLDRRSIAFVPPANTTVDLYALQALEAQEQWLEAAEFLNGDFLEGLYMDYCPEFENWLLGERDRWRDLAEAILRRIIEGHIRRGRYSDALNYARRLLQLTPWNEETHNQVMRLLAWTGQRGAALRQFESCKVTLWEELAVQPSELTITLYQQIQDGNLDLLPQLPAFLTDERARHGYERDPFVGRESELARLGTCVDEALAGRGQVIFISGGPGRGKTSLLETFARRSMEMHPKLMVASGKCNAYSGIGDPFLPYREVMAMLTGDVEGQWDAGAITRDHARRLWDSYSLVIQVLLDHGPHLLDIFVPGGALLSRAAAAGQDNAPWFPRLQRQLARNRTSPIEMEYSNLYQQVTRVLCNISQEKPLLLILDDMQWADTASISLLFHLARGLPDTRSRLLIACAYRPEEVTLDRAGQRHPLEKVLSEIRRNFGDVSVALDRTERQVDRKFVNALVDLSSNRLEESFREALFERTGGHPLFTVELLRAMKERGDLVKSVKEVWIEGPTLNWDVLPARVEAVIEERIAQVDSELQDILSVASVEGELFTAQVVAKVLNVEERPLFRRLSQDLERRHRLVREQEELFTGIRRLSRYRFGHVLFQDYLYRRLSLAERRLLHGDVALAMESIYEGQLEEMAVQLAHHFHQAGDHSRAFHYFTLAGQRASRLYQSREAISYNTQAIQLADSVSPDALSLSRLYHDRGLAFERLGEFHQAHTDLRTSLKIAQASGAYELAWRSSLDLGRLWSSRDYNQTRDYFEAALELAREIDQPEFLAVSLNWIGTWHANDEDPQKAAAYHQEALGIFENLNDRRELANTLDHLGMAHLIAGDLSASVHYYDRAIALFRKLDNRPRLASSLLGRATDGAMLIYLVSLPPETIPDYFGDFTEAFRIADEIDSAPDKAWANWSLGHWHILNNHLDQAIKVLERGLAIASGIGHREWEVCSRLALGRTYGELFAPVQASEQLKAALELAGELRSSYYIHLVSGSLAGVYLMMGDPILATDCLEAAISNQTPMDSLGKRYCWVRQAELALLNHNSAQALEITERLIASTPGMSPGRFVTGLWKLKAAVLAADDRFEEAISLLQAAIENVETSGERYLLWRLQAMLAQLLCTTGHQAAAEEANSAARAAVDEVAATLQDEELLVMFLQGAGAILGSSKDGA